MDEITINDITCRRPIHWQSSAETHVGKVRKVNEDAILSQQELGLWSVADGMGGHHVGDIASEMLVNALQKIENKTSLNDMVIAVEEQIINANQQMLDYAAGTLDQGMMGTTCVSLLIKGEVGICLWVGDSRLYRYRNGEFLQLTRDHSQLEEMLRMGLLDPKNADTYPNANVITRAVGAEEDICIDINVFDTRIGDTFLLCSDGLYNSIAADEISHCLRNKDTQTCVSQLMQKSLDNGAPDNVSIILIKGKPGKLTDLSQPEQTQIR